MGQHSGVFYYTLGQREGLHVGGIKGRPAAPWFVVGKDVEKNILYVDQGIDSLWLQSTELRSEPVHWVSEKPKSNEFRCTAKTRYRQADEDCLVQQLENGELSVIFDRPQRAVTPGQSVVFYQGDECLGGAVIASTNSKMETKVA